jgi:hypothetical protein
MKLLLGGSGCHERLPCRQISLTAPQGVEDDGLPDRQINRRGTAGAVPVRPTSDETLLAKKHEGHKGISPMRIIFALIALVASVVLGGCFYHHYQTAAVEPLPPPSYPPPIK